MRCNLSLAVVVAFTLGVLWNCGSDSETSYHGTPTGTFLSPRDGPGGAGYSVFDEACELVDDPEYLRRFETPMFRSVAEKDGVAYMVDGSLLWAVRITNPEQPERLSLTRMSGHPLQVAFAPGGELLVASGEAGLVVVDVTDASQPEPIAQVVLEEPALDVTVSGSLAVVSIGSGGIVVLDVSDARVPTVLSDFKVPGFAAAADVEGDIVYVAACSTLALVDLSDAAAPALIGSYWVPHGHAKDVDVVGTEVYVAGGEALFAYDAADASHVVWKGYYAEPEVPSFYVNAVVVQDGVAYIAAGDESVRSVEVANMVSSEGFPAEPVNSEEPPPLNGPEVLEDDNLRTIEIINQDPIGIGIAGDLLLVLGNFRWIGERTLRIMRIGEPGQMEDVGAYIQPETWTGLTAFDGALVLHGADGTEEVLTALDATSTLIPTGDATRVRFSLSDPVVATGSQDPYLYLLTEAGELYRWTSGWETGAQSMGYVAVDPEDMVLGQIRGYVADKHTNVIKTFNLPDAGGFSDDIIEPASAFLGYARLLTHAGRLYAYDRITGILHVYLDNAEGRPHLLSSVRIGQCEMYDIADYFAGRKGFRTIMRGHGDRIYMVCPHDEVGDSVIRVLDLRYPDRPRIKHTIPLPQGRYVDLVVRDTENRGQEFFLAGFDNSTYRSALLRITDNGETVHRADFFGHAEDLHLHNDVAVVLDGDAGIRMFEIRHAGDPRPIGLLPLP